ncbi:hypothetical protein [Streptacidiphilus sp. EB129]|uniref:hypothetical protein n=1 Tax=Streptacidiphilus sp. EB129 TaxID=3156262 RepID=UPI0035171B92
MPECRYMNTIPGRECVQIEFLPDEIGPILEDIAETSLGINTPTAVLARILGAAHDRFTHAAKETTP